MKWIIEDKTELVMYECTEKFQMYRIVEELKEMNHEYIIKEERLVK